MSRKKIVCSIVIILLLTFMCIMIISKNNTPDYDNYVQEDKLESFYDNVLIVDDIKEPNPITDNAIVDSAIEMIMFSENYKNAEVLDSWYDFGINKQSYNILFDGCVLYNIVLDGDKVLSNKIDYDYYLEYNK